VAPKAGFDGVFVWREYGVCDQVVFVVLVNLAGKVFSHR
jgi:hypothetical protein